MILMAMRCDAMWIFCIFSVINKLYTLIWACNHNHNERRRWQWWWWWFDANSKLMFINWQNHNQFQWNFFVLLSISFSHTWSTLHCYSRFVLFCFVFQFYCILISMLSCVFFLLLFTTIIIIIIMILKNPNRYKSTIISRCVMWTLTIGMSINAILKKKPMQTITFQMVRRTNNNTTQKKLILQKWIHQMESMFGCMTTKMESKNEH